MRVKVPKVSLFHLLHLDWIVAILSGLNCDGVLTLFCTGLINNISFSLSYLCILERIKTSWNFHLMANFSMTGGNDHEIGSFFEVLESIVRNIIFFLVTFLHLPQLQFMDYLTHFQDKRSPWMCCAHNSYQQETVGSFTFFGEIIWLYFKMQMLSIGIVL